MIYRLLCVGGNGTNINKNNNKNILQTENQQKNGKKNSSIILNIHTKNFELTLW